MSTSSQRESTDSIDDEHSSERAANDSIVYSIFNLLISFSLHFVCFFPIKSWHLQCCQKLLLEKEKKTLPFHALVKTLDYSVCFLLKDLSFLFFIRYFSQDAVTCVLVCVCNSLTYLRLAISAGLMVLWQYWGCVCLKKMYFIFFMHFSF